MPCRVSVHPRCGHRPVDETPRRTHRAHHLRAMVGVVEIKRRGPIAVNAARTISRTRCSVTSTTQQSPFSTMICRPVLLDRLASADASRRRSAMKCLAFTDMATEVPFSKPSRWMATSYVPGKFNRFVVGRCSGLHVLSAENNVALLITLVHRRALDTRGASFHQAR